MARQSLPQPTKPKRKRRKLPANVFERDGKWYVKIRFLDEHGRRRAAVRKCAKNPTHAREVREALRLELKVHGHQSLRNARNTFDDLATFFENTYLVPALFVKGIKASGRRSIAPAKSALKALKEHFGSTALRSITHSSLDGYKRRRLQTPVVFVKTVKTKNGVQKITSERPRAVATVDRELELLRRMFTIAVDEGWLLRSPFRKSDALISSAQENRRERIITEDEEALLLAWCTGKRAHLRPLLICALDTGMRWGEMTKMRVGDVDLNAGVVFVEGTHTKTLRSRRIGITARLGDELRPLCVGKKPTARIFQVGSVKTAWTTLRRKAGVSDVRWHDVRHTNATRIERSRVVSHGQLSAHLGHTNLRSTSRYINQDVKAAREIAEALERAVRLSRNDDAVRHANEILDEMHAKREKEESDAPVN